MIRVTTGHASKVDVVILARALAAWRLLAATAQTAVGSMALIPERFGNRASFNFYEGPVKYVEFPCILVVVGM